MIRTGSFLLPTPQPPEVLPGLTGEPLARALERELTRLNFLAEHLEHPTVAQGVVDGILEARAAVSAAAELHARVLGLSS